MEAKVINTTEYFNKSVDELLEECGNFTKEERLLFDDGLNVTFFDSQEEYNQEEKMFKKWMKERDFEIKAILKTINERIAFVLI